MFRMEMYYFILNISLPHMRNINTSSDSLALSIQLLGVQVSVLGRG